MSADRDDGPVYYREIQKNAYLKRIPNDEGGRLKPLGSKKAPLKPMWTLLCVHNGRTPYLEQYPSCEAPATLAHAPVWRASLAAVRHVTASVSPAAATATSAEYDFLVDTDHGPVRLLAPDWDSMQDWVRTLRIKLSELKVLPRGENLYMSPPAVPPARLPARDPTSPLPPTPPVPPDRVPGIEIITPRQPVIPEIPEPAQAEPPPPPPPPTTIEFSNPVDISNWDDPAPSTSNAEPIEERKLETSSVAKICGQNICLDDSVLKRKVTTDSDEEFFAEIDRFQLSDDSESVSDRVFKQRLVVEATSTHSLNENSDPTPSNVTVIQVSNKLPHTAIPVLGLETDVFDFEFKRNLPNPPGNTRENPNEFVNIVNTEVNVQNRPNDEYGTVFSDSSDYGHISLTTTVSLTGDVKETNDVNVTGVTANANVTAVNGSTDDSEGIYERLCMASTSKSTENSSPLPVRKIKNIDKLRKSSLPNLDSESQYEYLFPNFSNKNNNRSKTNQPPSVSNSSKPNISNTTLNNSNHASREEINSNVHITPIRPRNIPKETPRSITSTHNIPTSDFRHNNSEVRTNIVHVNASTVTISANLSLNDREIRSNIERSHSQNAYDTAPNLRDQLIRRVKNHSPKRDGKNDKPESHQTKPIWKRGLTELSLLTKLRGLGQGKRQESPTRHESEQDRTAPSQGKVVHRSRGDARVDNTRRRSSSLTNQWDGSLLASSAASLRAAQRRAAPLVAQLPPHARIVLASYADQIWIASWGGAHTAGGRCGDRAAAAGGAPAHSLPAVRRALARAHARPIDILFHRVPLGKIYVLQKRDFEGLGIKLDNECNITNVERDSPASRAGLPPPGKWAVTEVNNRPINIVKGGEEEMNRISLHGTEASVLIQPSPLVKKLRAALKANKFIKSHQ